MTSRSKNSSLSPIIQSIEIVQKISSVNVVSFGKIRPSFSIVVPLIEIFTSTIILAILGLAI